MPNSVDRRIRTTGRLATLLGLTLASGCSDAVSVLPGLPGLPVPDLVRVVKDVDRPDNVIERGLSQCGRGRTVAGETACLKDALAADHVGVSELIKIVPACRVGAVCHYQYTTVDRVGFVPVTQSNYTVRWQVDFDLRKPVKTPADIPITMTVI